MKEDVRLVAAIAAMDSMENEVVDDIQDSKERYTLAEAGAEYREVFSP